MFTFHICLCPGACLFWIIKQRALSSFRLFLSLFNSLTLSKSKLYPWCSSFSCSCMSVQPALAEAMALTEMQMAAFEGAHWERQLIQAFTRRKKKKAVQPLFVGCFISIVLQGHVFIHCPRASGFRGLFKDSGYIRIGRKARKWHRKLRKLRWHRTRAALHIPSYLCFSLNPF